MRAVAVGEVQGAYGIRGWIKVRSHTESRENILRYSPWYLEQGGELRPYFVSNGRVHGSDVVAELSGVADRDAAAALRGMKIWADRAQFPPLEAGAYYWADLIGLEVRNLAGQRLGVVADLMATGANDVLVVHGERERLVPFVLDRYVTRVDLTKGEIVVDWGADF